MAVKYFIDDKFIPDDGAIGVINRFSKNTDSDILVYPDVHLKRNSKIANGTLISSHNNVYLSCLGVENCGFTFGKITDINEAELVKSFRNYSQILGNRNRLPEYSIDEIQGKFDSLLRKDYEKRQFLYEFLGYNSLSHMLSDAHRILDGDIIKLACKTICTLGGGNHFFEIHKIVNGFKNNDFQEGSFIFMLHSDSIAVGDLVFNLYSDLWEMYMNSPRRFKQKVAVRLFREKQKRYFKRIGLPYAKYKEDVDKIFNHGDNYKYVEADSVIGRNLLFVHNICSLFGDMNRHEIIKLWSETQKIGIDILGNHSHDNVSVEMYKGERKIVHRNGVQYIGEDSYCILPGAMGSYSFILSNGRSEDAYFSTNHGTGRMQDKHIAKDKYTENQTIKELNEHNIALFKVGSGNLAEQNMHSFKNPDDILEQMQKYELAKPIAKTMPIAIIKG